jgi:hypothetical protein
MYTHDSTPMQKPEQADFKTVDSELRGNTDCPGWYWDNFLSRFKVCNIEIKNYQNIGICISVRYIVLGSVK